VRQTLFNLAAALSLLLCVAAVALWVRSYWREDAYQFRGRDGQLWEVASRQGKLWLDNRRQVVLDYAPVKALQQRDHDATAYLERISHTASSEEIHRADLLAKMAKVDFVREAIRLESLGWAFHSPVGYAVEFRLALLATLFLPVMWLFTELRTRARQAGNRCVRCGYDLRATPDRCPECGTVVPKATT
jgi:hypothetical protein